MKENVPSNQFSHKFISKYLGTENNFEKASPHSTSAFGVGYDYGSVMHYSSYAFSKNGQATISAKVSFIFFYFFVNFIFL